MGSIFCTITPNNTSCLRRKTRELHILRLILCALACCNSNRLNICESCNGAIILSCRGHLQQTVPTLGNCSSQRQRDNCTVSNFNIVLKTKCQSRLWLGAIVLNNNSLIRVHITVRTRTHNYTGKCHCCNLLRNISFYFVPKIHSLQQSAYLLNIGSHSVDTRGILINSNFCLCN